MCVHVCPICVPLFRTNIMGGCVPVCALGAELLAQLLRVFSPGDEGRRHPDQHQGIKESIRQDVIGRPGGPSGSISPGQMLTLWHL